MQNIDGKSLICQLTPEVLRRSVGEDISLSACVHKLQSASSFIFVMVRTGRYVLQTICDKKICETDPRDLCEGAYIELYGSVKDEPRAPFGFEITLKRFRVLSKPTADYPLRVSDRVLGCTIEENLKNRSVALRHPRERAVLKICEGVASGFREFMVKEGFTEIHSPKICAAATEGGTNVFRLKYFGDDAMLAQSPQLYKQICIAFFDRVFEIAPSYRAEKHNSTRHLAEFIGLDLEMGYIRDMTDIMQTATAALKYIISYLDKGYDAELELLGAALPRIDSIPSVTFYEALDILDKKRDQLDLDPTDQMRLCQYAKETFGSRFVFVTKFPAAKRQFYEMASPDSDTLSETFDLLFDGLEIASGGQRIHDYDTQLEKLSQLGISTKGLTEYLSSHRYGLPPHGGLCIGSERLVMKLLGLENIRQASLFPRDMHSFTNE